MLDWRWWLPEPVAGPIAVVVLRPGFVTDWQEPLLRSIISYLCFTDCTIRNKLPYFLPGRIGQMNKVLSVSAKDIPLNIQKCQVVRVNALRPLLVSDHFIDDGFDITDRVDAEVPN